MKHHLDCIYKTSLLNMIILFVKEFWFLFENCDTIAYSDHTVIEGTVFIIALWCKSDDPQQQGAPETNETPSSRASGWIGRSGEQKRPGTLGTEVWHV